MQCIGVTEYNEINKVYVSKIWLVVLYVQYSLKIEILKTCQCKNRPIFEMKRSNLVNGLNIIELLILCTIIKTKKRVTQILKSCGAQYS